MNYESKLSLMVKSKGLDINNSMHINESDVDTNYKQFNNSTYLIDKYYNSNFPIQNMPSVFII